MFTQSIRTERGNLNENETYAGFSSDGHTVALLWMQRKQQQLFFAESAKRPLELTEKGVSYWAQYLEQQEVGKPQDVVEQENHLSYLLQYPEIGKERIDARISEIVTEIRNAFDAEFTPTEEEKKEKKQTDAILYLGYESYLAKENQLSLVFFETHETNGELSPHTQIQVFHFDLEKDAEVTAGKPAIGQLCEKCFCLHGKILHNDRAL